MLSKNNDIHIKINKKSKGKEIIEVNNIDEITLDEINEEEEEEKNNINDLTLDEIDNENEPKEETQENNISNNLSLEIINNQDDMTLNVETTVEEKPKKRGRPKKNP